MNDLANTEEDLSIYNPEGSDLRRAQIRMLEMFDAFVEICNRHSITYWLACGNLLGAHRHGGFIPWDDDLDIVVLQRDYHQLLSYLKNELPKDFKLQARGEGDKKYWYYFAKIRDTKSRLYPRKPRNFDLQGLFIDIHPIEAVPSMQFKKLVDKILFSEMHFEKAKSLLQKFKYALILCLLPLAHLLIKTSRTFYKYVKTNRFAYSYGIFFYSPYNMEYFFPVGKIMFEGKLYNAPSNIEGYLKDNFGPNYMRIPKVGSRVNHTLKIEFL